ncbi:MAG TPA: GlsB/YeaQ/YmgE family stress response membrane protein [Candidatus Woesebacteria bacterium]|nr:GlsB/YeaQ/YmgE family stress response membrane protein [Candidatus Woesebacteria bacterium]
MTLLLWIILGIITGILASVVLRTHLTQGFVTDITLGIIGALFGGLILNILGQPGLYDADIISFVIILLGSSVLIWFGRMINAPSR